MTFNETKVSDGITQLPTEHICGSCSHRCVGKSPLGVRRVCLHECLLEKVAA